MSGPLARCDLDLGGRWKRKPVGQFWVSFEWLVYCSCGAPTRRGVVLLLLSSCWPELAELCAIVCQCFGWCLFLRWRVLLGQHVDHCQPLLGFGKSYSLSECSALSTCCRCNLCLSVSRLGRLWIEWLEYNGQRIDRAQGTL